MKSASLILLCIALCQAVPTSRIVGGENAADGQFPFVASIRNRFGIHFCGSIIINSKWLMSTATCFTSINLADVSVTVGSNLLSEAKHYRIAQAVIHKNYTESTRENNLALFRINGTLTFGQNVQPAVIVEHEIHDGRMVVAGWGRNAAGDVPNNLQFIETTMLEKETCKEFIKNLNENEICAISGEGKSACIGDQGGPLLLDDEGVVAVMSFTISAECGLAFPDGYQTLLNYVEWIEAVSNSN